MDGENTDVQLVGSTGQNDSSSPWGKGLLDSLGALSDSAGKIISATKGNKTAKPSTGIPQWAYLAIGGGLLLLVVALVFRR